MGFPVCLNAADLRTLSHGYVDTNPQIPQNCFSPSPKVTGKLKPSISSQKICGFAARTRYKLWFTDGFSGTFLTPDLELQGCISIFIDAPCYSPIAQGHFLQEFIADIKPEAKAEKSIFPIDCFLNVFLNYFHFSLTCKWNKNTVVGLGLSKCKNTAAG